MVHLTKIYTRTGDAGQTRLSDNSVAAKTDLRVEAYGQVDEANAVLGVATARGDLPDDLIVTDLNMPNMDGLRMIEELRRLPNQIGVPISSSGATEVV